MQEGKHEEKSSGSTNQELPPYNDQDVITFTMTKGQFWELFQKAKGECHLELEDSKGNKLTINGHGRTKKEGDFPDVRFYNGILFGLIGLRNDFLEKYGSPNYL